MPHRHTSFVCEPENQEKLTKAAKIQRRSRSAIINQLIDEAFDKAGRRARQ